MSFGQAIGIFVVAFLALLAINSAFPGDPSKKSNYCEMVEIYKDSGGEFGWPDFRNNYESACK